MSPSCTKAQRIIRSLTSSTARLTNKLTRMLQTTSTVTSFFFHSGISIQFSVIHLTMINRTAGLYNPGKLDFLSFFVAAELNLAPSSPVTAGTSPGVGCRSVVGVKFSFDANK